MKHPYQEIFYHLTGHGLKFEPGTGAQIQKEASLFVFSMFKQLIKAGILQLLGRNGVSF